MPLDGKGEGTTLAETEFFYVGSPHFSPGGQRVAFDGYKGDAENVHPECWVVRADGTGVRKLADGATPRWSPDGERLLLTRDRRPGEEGGAVAPVTTGPMNDRSPGRQAERVRRRGG